YEVECSLCGAWVVSVSGSWINGHTPVIRIGPDGCIEAGYYCGKKDREVIILRDCKLGSGGGEFTNIME
ncbi:MAG: hypothetical protein ACP5L1_10085, partial [Caldivirga sp.]|uniref:hypothetical protein n=1 Tax=Caldivirga sp. TaxID=2080243 RepID=UPI003D131DF4